MNLSFNESSLKIGTFSALSAISETATGIVLWNFDKIPPHLGMIYQGSYYSLTIKAVDCIDFKSIQKVWKIKQKPILIFEIETQDHPILEVISHFNHYPHVDAQVSCLQPILSFFNTLLELKIEATVIFDLLKALNHANKIKNIYSNAQSVEINIPYYSKKDVEHYIKKLKEQTTEQKNR